MASKHSQTNLTPDFFRDSIFWLFLCLGLIFYYPIISEHFYYRDDYDRALRAISNFKFAGRFAGDYIAHFVSGDFIIFGNAAFGRMADTAPLFQLFSLLLFIYSVYKAIKIRNIPLDGLSLFAVAAFIFNPFFIQNLLYRFDSLPMAVACVSAIFAWALWIKNSKASFLLLLLTLSTYQTFINLFIFLCIIEFLYRIVFEDQFWPFAKNLVYALICALAALLVYRFLLVLVFARGASRHDLMGLKDFELLKIKFTMTMEFVTGFFTIRGERFFFALMVLALIEIGLNIYRQNVRLALKVIKFICVFFGLAAIAFLALGPFLFLTDPIVQPRMMFAANLLMVAVVFLSTRFIARRFSRLAGVVGVFYLVCPLAFSYAVNNGLSNQQTFEDRIMAGLNQDLTRIAVREKPILVQGNLPFAPLNERTIKESLLAANIAGPNPDWVLGMQLFAMGQSTIKFDWDGPGVTEADICSHAVEISILTSYYMIFERENDYFVLIGQQPGCLKASNAAKINRDN